MEISDPRPSEEKEVSVGWVSLRGLSERQSMRGGEGFREEHLKTEGFPECGVAGPAVGKGYGGLVRRSFWMKGGLWGARWQMENGDEIPGKGGCL